MGNKRDFYGSARPKTVLVVPVYTPVNVNLRSGLYFSLVNKGLIQMLPGFGCNSDWLISSKSITQHLMHCFDWLMLIRYDIFSRCNYN